MSTTAAALTVFAVLAVSLPAAYWQIRRALAEGESTRERLIREAHERADAAAVEELDRVWELPAYDRELDAFCDRLRQAIRETREEDGTP